MFPPSLHLSNSPANTQAVFPSAVAGWGVGGWGQEGNRNSPHLYNGGTKVGGIPSGWPCLPSSGAGFLSSGDQ